MIITMLLSVGCFTSYGDVKASGESVSESRTDENNEITFIVSGLADIRRQIKPEEFMSDQMESIIGSRGRYVFDGGQYFRLQSDESAGRR